MAEGETGGMREGGPAAATPLQLYIAVVATAGLVFAIGAWWTARGAVQTAEEAYLAASSVDTDSASWQVLQLQEQLVAAGVIEDPQYAHLAAASPTAVTQEVCGWLLLEGQHPIVAATTAEAIDFARRFEVGGVSEAAGMAAEAAAAAVHLGRPDLTAGLGSISRGWLALAGDRPDGSIPDGEVRDVWGPLESYTDVRAAAAWFDASC